MTEADFAVVRKVTEAVMQMQSGLIRILSQIIDQEIAEEIAAAPADKPKAKGRRGRIGGSDEQ
jgi:hypothetical protein